MLFEVAQYDTYAYLFDQPHYITLDGSAPPTNAQMRGMRVAMNGQEVEKGQSYANLDQTLAVGTAELGQPLSVLGAVLPLEKGPDSDEFFLTFDELGSASYTRTPDPSLFIDGRDQVVNAADLPEASHVGVRTFDEINATFAAVTGIDPTTPAVATTYGELRQSLPAVEDVSTFLSSHQVALAQLAIEYCNALIDGPSAATYFPNFNFGDPKNTAFSAANRSNFVDPLIKNIVGHIASDPQIGTQPTYTEVYSELASFGGSGNRPENLIDRLVAGTSDTIAISKGVCAAALGSAVTLVQ